MIRNHPTIASLSRRGGGRESESRKHLPPRRIATINYGSKVIRRRVVRFSLNVDAEKEVDDPTGTGDTQHTHDIHNYEAARRVGG